MKLSDGGKATTVKGVVLDIQKEGNLFCAYHWDDNVSVLIARYREDGRLMENVIGQLNVPETIKVKDDELELRGI